MYLAKVEEDRDEDKKNKTLKENTYIILFPSKYSWAKSGFVN